MVAVPLFILQDTYENPLLITAALGTGTPVATDIPTNKPNPNIAVISILTKMTLTIRRDLPTSLIYVTPRLYQGKYLTLLN